MRVLLVSATLLEVKPFLEKLACDAGALARIPSAGAVIPLPRGRLHSGVTITGDCVITGVGAPIAAIHLMHTLGKTDREQYDLVLQVGLAGSFSQEFFPKKSVVRIASEAFADLGAEDNGTFLDLFEMGLQERNAFPFTEGVIEPVRPLLTPPFDGIPLARSVTVNRVLSESASVAWVRKRFQPDVVNMEGAAFFYAAMVWGVPCASVRVISDIVGPRDRSSWDIPGAVETLSSFLQSWWGK